MRLTLNLCDIGIDATFLTTLIGLIIHTAKYLKRFQRMVMAIETIRRRIARKSNLEEVEKLIKENIIPLQLRIDQIEKILDSIIVIKTKSSKK